MALVKPYSRVTLAFVSKELALPLEDVEALLVDMIMDKRIDGQIDQINMFLALSTSKSHAERRDDALVKMADTISSLSRNLAARVQ